MKTKMDRQETVNRLFIYKDAADEFVVLQTDSFPESETNDIYFSGTVIHVERGSSWDVGHNYDQWVKHQFSPFEGKIEISS